MFLSFVFVQNKEVIIIFSKCSNDNPAASGTTREGVTMRRTILVTLLLVLFFSLSTTQVETETVVQNIFLDGIPMILLPEPIAQNSELMVPLRLMAEAMGAEISWDPENQAIRGNRQERSFAVRLDNDRGSINGQAVTLPRPVQMMKQQSYVPLSFLCDALGARWERDGATIRIYDRSDPSSTVSFSLAKTPILRFANLPEAGQGEYLSLFIDNIEAGDTVTLQTTLDSGANFYPCGSGKLLLLPISCTQSPGIYSLKIKAQREGHTYLWAQEIIRVLPRTFTVQHLNVSAQTAAQRGEDFWALDQPFRDRGLANSAARPLWMGTFVWPTVGRISTEFGSVRIVNQEAPSQHSGLDIAVPTGTPVRASQDGVVSLAMPLNVTGNTVFIDHGCQLFSMYYHLSRILVKEGQAVKAGDLIGEVGSTGFSTGPHLHWAIQLHGIFVNPARFLMPVNVPRTDFDATNA